MSEYDNSQFDWWEIPLWKWRNDRNQYAKTREIDYQRDRVYRAEDASGIKTCQQKTFPSIEACQQYVDSLTTKSYFKRRFGVVMITAIYRPVGHAMGCRINETKGKIWLPRWAWAEWVILHEMAHAINPPAAGSAHGRRWCKIYLELVKENMGQEWSTRLRETFVKYGVKTQPKRPPTKIGEECAAKRAAYYIKSDIPPFVAGPDAYPDRIDQVTNWIETQQEWPEGSVKMRRVLTPGYFEVWQAPRLQRVVKINKYALADLSLSEWHAVFIEAWHAQQG